MRRGLLVQVVGGDAALGLMPHRLEDLGAVVEELVLLRERPLLPGPLALVEPGDRPVPQPDDVAEQPVDGVGEVVLDLALVVADDLPAELLLERVAVAEHLDLAHADVVFEELHAPPLHVHEDVVDLGEEALVASVEVAFLLGEVGVEPFELRLVFGKQRLAFVQTSSEHVEPLGGGVEGGGELEGELLRPGEGLIQEPLQFGEPALLHERPALAVRRRLRTERLPRADGEDARLEPQQLLAARLDVVDDLVEVAFPLGGEVGLVEDEDEPLAPVVPYEVQEHPLRLGEGPVEGGDEEDEVGAGDEVLGDLLVAAHGPSSCRACRRG